MRSLATVGIILALSLAGCAGDNDQPDTTTDASISPSATIGGAVAQSPIWNLGQGWTYTVEVPGDPTRRFEMMVAQERSDLWVVASSDQAQALHHAVYSTNPVLGRINKTTFSPFQDGQPVSMFQFPLTDGKTWNAQFFGEDMRFEAKYAGDLDVSRVNARHGLGTNTEGFRITAKSTSGQEVRYDYVEAAEWFSSFEHRTAAGERDIKLTLVDLEAAYKGPFSFFRASDAIAQTETHAAASGLTTKTLTGDVDAAFADRVAIGIEYVGTSGTVPPSANVTLKDPTGAVVWSRDFTTATQIHDLRDLAGKSGAWSVDLRLAGTLSIEVRVVGIQNYAVGTL